MEYQKLGTYYVLRLEVGEEVNQTIKEFCRKEKIRSGKISGIGMLREAVISYFVPSLGEYQHKPIEEFVELTSLVGNISIMDGEVIPHLHATLADAQFNLFGGHLTSGEIGVTGEIILEPFQGVIVRKKHQETGLRLLALGE